jgi:hypothetical protein
LVWEEGILKFRLKTPDEIDFSKLIKSFPKGSRIGLYSDENINLVTNTHFMLNISEEMMWRLQCKFEIRWNNGWYYVGGDNRKKTEQSKMMELYSSITTNPDLKPFEVTNLRTDDCDLLVGADGYAIVQTKYMNLFSDIQNIKALDQWSPFLINNQHIVTPVRYGEGSIEKWLRPIKHETAV